MARLQVLVMCMANICRSPIAEQLMARGLAEVGIEADFSSAGFLESGRAIDNRSVSALHSRGVDAGDHLSTQVRGDLVDGADLVVVMEADHLRRLVGDDPSRFSKVFTLRGLANQVHEIGPRLPDEPMMEWIERLNAGRQHRDFLGTTTKLDVSDPYRFGNDGFSQIADEIAVLVGAFVAGADGRTVASIPAKDESSGSSSGRRRFWSRK